MNRNGEEDKEVKMKDHRRVEVEGVENEEVDNRGKEDIIVGTKK